MPHLSTSEVMIHEEALYQVYVALPYRKYIGNAMLEFMTFSTKNMTINNSIKVS